MREENGFLQLPKSEYCGKGVECVQGEKREDEKES